LNFSFEDNANQAATAIFAIDPTSAIATVALRAARLSIGLGGAGTASMFDVPASWTVYADYADLHNGLGATLPANWSGPVGNLTFPVRSYQVLNRWSTGTRPTPVPLGTIGFATDTNRIEFYDNSVWSTFLRAGGDR
jgi:hypothetical protein